VSLRYVVIMQDMKVSEVEDLEKLEKIIEALEACVLKDPDDSRDCRHCPRCNYGAFITTSCINGVMNDALALLKAQEPRVLTLDEALNGLVIEYRSGKLQEVGKRVFTKGFDYYGDLWRVWDRMPTDEQREAKPWN